MFEVNVHTHTHTSGNDVGKLRATRVTDEKLPRRAINHVQISRDCRRVKLDCIFALIVRDSGTRVLVKRMINSSASSVKPLYIFSARHRVWLTIWKRRDTGMAACVWISIKCSLFCSLRVLLLVQLSVYLHRRSTGDRKGENESKRIARFVLLLFSNHYVIYNIYTLYII